MRYTLLLHYAEEDSSTIGPEAIQAGMDAFAAYAAALEKARVLVSGEVLQPSLLTTTVQVRGGDTRIQDGPYAETKEQLGGIIVIEVPDLDAAIEWARQAPPAHWGAVEIRPGATRIVEGAWVPHR